MKDEADKQTEDIGFLMTFGSAHNALLLHHAVARDAWRNPKTLELVAFVKGVFGDDDRIISFMKYYLDSEIDPHNWLPDQTDLITSDYLLADYEATEKFERDLPRN